MKYNLKIIATSALICQTSIAENSNSMLTKLLALLLLTGISLAPEDANMNKLKTDLTIILIITNLIEFAKQVAMEDMDDAYYNIGSHTSTFSPQ
jgi:hypothetical protein